MYVGLIMSMVIAPLKRGKESVGEACEVLQDLNISNEVMKEHVMGLSMDAKLLSEFEQLDTQVKSAFTREYNKRNNSNTTGTVLKKKKAPKSSQDDTTTPSKQPQDSIGESDNEEDIETESENDEE